MSFDDREMTYLRRCVELARAAFEHGDEAFGSVLVDAAGTIRAEDRNRIAGGDKTRHPEFFLARWAAENMSPEERAEATVYTSGEHCPMCAAAHAWVGLGRIVYIMSSAQLSQWREEHGLPTLAVNPLPVREGAPGLEVHGPVAPLDDELLKLPE